MNRITTLPNNPSFLIRNSTGDFMIGISEEKGTVAYIRPDLYDQIFSFTANDK